MNKIKLLGIIAIILGAAAALLCLTPPPRGLLFALPVGFLGMVASGIYVYIDTKYEIHTKKFTPGIIGMLLSSVPVLLILAVIIISHFKN